MLVPAMAHASAPRGCGSARSAGVLLAALATSCVSSPRPITGTAAPPQARVDLVDTSQPLRIVERSPDGTICVLWGGLRAVLSRDAVTLAEESFRDPVEHAVHAERGWVFASRDGAAAASDTFAGPLRVLPPLDAPDSLAGRGVAVTVDAGGAVLVSDGRGLFGRTPTQPPFAAARAVFEGPLRGAAVLVSGELYATADGGETWRYAGASIDAAALQVDEFGIYERAPGQANPRALRPDGTLAPPAPRLALGLISNAPSASELVALQDRLRAALRRRNPAFVLPSAVTRVPDGTVLITEGSVVVEVTPTGERRRREAPTTIATLARERHGADLAGFEVYRADLAAAVSLPITARDEPPLLRVGTVSSPTRDLVLSRPLSAIAAVDASYAWGWATGDAGPRSIAVRVDLATGSVDALWTSPLDGPCRPGVCEFVADGTLFIVAGETLVRVGPRSREELALPRGAVRIAFSDALRGMAYGERNDAVWITCDGGHTWLTVDLGGPATGSALVGRDALCHALGCFVAGVAIEGYDVARLRSRIVANARRGSPPEAPWMPAWYARMPVARCSEDGAWDLPPWSRAGDVRGVAAVPTGEARVIERPATLPDSRMDLAGCSESIEWRGVDEAGPFYAASPWHMGRHRCTDPLFAWAWGWRWTSVRALSRERVTLFFSGAQECQGNGTLRVASAAESSSGVGSLADQGSSRSWFTPRNGVYLGGCLAPYVTAYGADGFSRSRLVPEGAIVSLAERGATPGAVYWLSREPGRARFVPADDSLPGETVTIPSPDRVAPCATPAAPEALRIAVPSPTRADDRGPEPAQGPYTVEIDGDRVCIRGAQGIHGHASRAWPASGGLVGVTYEPAGAARLRCELRDAT